jgi:serine-type D-Ala-D-Ala carboxypeptidase/endopeptidase (penicillin-binding protein 4)
MPLHRRFAALFLLWSSATLAQLPPSVAKALADAGIPESAVGVVALPLTQSRPMLEVGGNTPLNPASTMKLLTTFAALELLGPAATWQTETWASTSPKNGVLTGDLYLKGSGDPKLTHEQMWRLLRSTHDAGISEIRGALVQDRTAFAAEAVDPGQFDGQAMRPYNVQPDALLTNFNAITLSLTAESQGIRVSAQPVFSNLKIDNRLTLNRKTSECGEWRKALTAELIHNGPKMSLKLTGAYPAVCGAKQWNLSPLPRAEYVAGVFDALWAEIAGRSAAKIKIHPVREDMVPADAQLIASVTSPTVGEIVRDINKFSNNVMARQIMLTLALNAGIRPARTTDAEAVIRAWLISRKLEFPELVIDNGAGLSRIERISANNLVRLLSAAWRSAVMPEFIASLPIVAVDGTMKKRFADTAASIDGNGIKGQAHIKTGSLDSVRTIAGYVLDQHGQRWALAFLVNHPNADKSRAAQDALLEWVYAGGVAL